MGEEMQGAPVGAGWSKAIPFQRDQLQGRMLVWVVGGLLIGLLCVQTWLLPGGSLHPVWFVAGCVFSAGFAVLVWKMRAATGAAAFLGGVICMNMLLAGQRVPHWRQNAVPALVALFVLTSAATRFGRGRKEALGMAEALGGRRGVQIVANLGIAGLCVGGASEVWLMASIAALAEATADTVSSEMGQALGGTTWLITSGRRVPGGTDGGVSMTGTVLGMAAAAVTVGVAVLGGAISLRLGWIAFAAGVAGLLFDSVLGATLERRGWIGSDLVNLASTAFAAGAAYFAYGFAGPGIVRW